MKYKIPVAEPLIGEEEKQAVAEVMDTGFISQGEKVVEFEEKIAKLLGRKYAVACHSGTCANEVMLMALTQPTASSMLERTSISHVGALLACSSVAVSNPLLYAGILPKFYDLDNNLCLDGTKLLTDVTTPIGFVMNVYSYGSIPIDFKTILYYCKIYGVPLLEDTCVALGTKYNNKPAGSFGAMASLSFYTNKTITCGEGGMVVTDDEDYAQYCREYVNHGRKKSVYHEEWYYNHIGRNAKMTDIQAAIGLAQLEKLPKFIEARKKIAGELYDTVKGDKRYSCFKPDVEVTPWNFWIVGNNTINMKEKSMILQTKYGIETRPTMPILPHLPFYGFHEIYPIALESQNGFLVSCSPKVIDDGNLEYLTDSVFEVLNNV